MSEVPFKSDHHGQRRYLKKAWARENPILGPGLKNTSFPVVRILKRVLHLDKLDVTFAILESPIMI